MAIMRAMAAQAAGILAMGLAVAAAVAAEMGDILSSFLLYLLMQEVLR